MRDPLPAALRWLGWLVCCPALAYLCLLGLKWWAMQQPCGVGPVLRTALAALAWFGALLWVPYALLACVFNARRLRVTDVSDRQRRAAVLVIGLIVAGNWIYLLLSR